MACGGLSIWNHLHRVAPATMFPWFVLKTHRTLTFSATIGNDGYSMKTLAVISILALLTISGAAWTDQILTSDQRMAQGTD
jgi:hypothetical protein